MTMYVFYLIVCMSCRFHAVVVFTYSMFENCAIQRCNLILYSNEKQGDEIKGVKEINRKWRKMEIQKVFRC
jgi:hypothetical protein